MRLLARTAVACALAAPAVGQVGGPPPELDPARWFQSPPLTFEDLRGKAVLIEFFRTWDQNSASNVPALGSRYAKGAKKGLMVIGVTFEDPDLVEHWVRRLEPEYPVVAVRTNELEGFLGVRGHPTQAVIDGAGSVTYVGFSPESALSDALKGAERGPFWPKSLSKVVDRISTGDPIEAWEELMRVLDRRRLDEQEAQRAERLRLYLEGVAAGEVARARTFLEEGVIYRAVAAVRPIARAEVPFPASEEAAALLAEIEALEGFEREMKAAEDFEEARALDLTRAYTKAFEAYAELAGRFEGTRLAKVARARAQELIDEKKIGFRTDCEACTSEDEACEKHREEAELD